MKKVKLKYAFALVGMHLEQFAAFEDAFRFGDKKELETIFKYVTNDHDRLGVICTVTLRQKERMCFTISVVSEYKFGEDTWRAFLVENEGFVIPQDLIQHLTAVSVGNTRGVLFARTQGTVFSAFLLPLINVAEQVRGDVKLGIHN